MKDKYIQKQLDNELGIKHIPKPKDLEPLKDYVKDDYNDPSYPYKSKWIEQQPKKKKVAKKRSKKKAVKRPLKKVVVKKPIENKVVEKTNVLNKILKWFFK